MVLDQEHFYQPQFLQPMSQQPGLPESIVRTVRMNTVYPGILSVSVVNSGYQWDNTRHGPSSGRYTEPQHHRSTEL